MELDLLESTKDNEIAELLCDVRDYFKASLETSEYENTSNEFFVTASETSEQLLHRCEALLARLNKTFKLNNVESNGCNNNNKKLDNVIARSANNCDDKIQGTYKNGAKDLMQQEDAFYIDMTAKVSSNLARTPSPKFLSCLTNSTDSDKTFRCSTKFTKQNHNFLHSNITIINGGIGSTKSLHTASFDDDGDHHINENSNGNDVNDYDDDDDDDDESATIYDICKVTTEGSDGEEDHVLKMAPKPVTPDSDTFLPNVPCPYKNLPAGHLAIQKSSKYGQLNRIEKRLFFDQSRKYYCGILEDWFLCYADGPLAPQPSISLYLKISGIQIEHFGEGKRRDVCFQISTADPNKRFVFQAVNEVDAKEWIHAIETAIRHDIDGMVLSKLTATTIRKLPTPPSQKKLSFLSTFQTNNNSNNSTNDSQKLISNHPAMNQAVCDSIYEEPSPLYQVCESSESLIMKEKERDKNEEEVEGLKPPDLPLKQNSPGALAQRFDYDIPKCPTQSLKTNYIEKFDENKIVVITTTTTPTTIIATTCMDTTGKSPIKSYSHLPKIDNEDKWDFQTKIKDVHNMLSSQLISGPLNLKKSNKSSYMSANQHDINYVITNTSLPSTPTAMDKKKQRKSTTRNSPQKVALSLSLVPPEKPAKNWFLNRLNKGNSLSNRQHSNGITTVLATSPTKTTKQSEKENLLNSSSSETGCDSLDSSLESQLVNSIHHNPASPILKQASTSPIAGITAAVATPNGNGKSKVNMIINELRLK